MQQAKNNSDGYNRSNETNNQLNRFLNDFVGGFNFFFLKI